MSEVKIKSLAWKAKNKEILKLESVSYYLEETIETQIINLEEGQLEITIVTNGNMKFDVEKNELQLEDNTEYWVTYDEKSDLFMLELVVMALEKIYKGKGILNSNNYVGRLEFGIESFTIAVKSKKIDYDKDFEFLRQNIAEFSKELLSRSSSFYGAHFCKGEIYKDNKINYSEIAYLKSMLSPDKLQAWLDYLVSHSEHKFDRRIEKRNITEIEEINVDYYISALEGGNIQKSVKIVGDVEVAPIEMLSEFYEMTYDIPENKFVKFLLQYLLELVESILAKSDKSKNHKLIYELQMMLSILEDKLQHPFWKNISRLERIPFESQILQRKYPYNMIFQMYTELEMESRVDLGEVDKQFVVGQKDAPMLYQYWVFILFFKYLNKKYEERYVTSSWLTYDEDNLTFTLSEGCTNKVKYTVSNDSELHLLYNKTYSRDNEIYSGRSYSHDLKPDISLELFKENKLVAIIHFDAKYKKPINGEDVPDDINKMHAYKDGILGTIGAYAICLADRKIIYRENEKEEKTEGLFPSVGACPLNLRQGTLETEIENIMYIVDEFGKIECRKEIAKYSKEHLKKYDALTRKLMEIKE